MILGKHKNNLVIRNPGQTQYAVILAVAWTVVVSVSLAWTAREHQRATNEMARSQARAGFDRDLLFRRWNALHGGVYVPITERTPPNPHLRVRERDIRTAAGRELTLVNPAYMTRQVHELGAKTNGLQGHITSLNPIRPENKADPWETAALKSFEQGVKERSSIELYRGEPYLRLMKPLIAEKSCLKCHGHQGYQEGDVRGGISISVPMAPLRAIGHSAMVSALAWHGAFWILGLLGIGFSYRHLAKQARQLSAEETRVQESEQRFMDVLYASVDAILLLDGDVFVDCNDAAADLLKYSSRKEFLMLRPSELSPPEQPDGRDSLEKAEEMIRIAFEKGPHRFQWIHRKADGEDFPVDVTLTPIAYHGRTILHCLWRDLTETMRVKEERERARKATEKILESMPVGVVIIGRDKIVRHANPTAVAMMGYESDRDIVGRVCHQALCPSRMNACPIVDLGRTVENAERTLLDKDKNRVSILKTVIPITIDDEDVLLETFVDITQRKAAEERLRKLSSAIEQNPASVVITNTDGMIEYVNPGFTKNTGYALDEVVGRNPRVLRSGVHPPEFYAQMWESLRAAEVWRGEICNRRKNGELYWEDAMISPVTDERGTTTHFVAVKVDISARKDVERALIAAKEDAVAANRAKSRFLASMSHELRTPLTGILGFTDLLLGSVVNEKERREYLEIVQSSGRHLLELINAILDLSKIEASQLVVKRAACAPHKILSNVINLMHAQTQAKGLDIRCRWTGSVPAFIETDASRLRQILLNLVGNAVKFTQHGAVEVVAHVEAVGEGNKKKHKLFVDVTDSGVGIAEDKLESIFEPFVQADDSVTREFGGTGLGLAITSRLANALGGAVFVNSELGVGSTFTVSVDAGDLKGVQMLTSPLADGVEAGQTVLLPSDSTHFHAERVLLIEDGQVNRKLIATVLEQAGLNVRTAENGQIGVDMATRDHFDLILMDMQMPILDGYAATQKLRALGNDTPIIAITAHAMKEDEEKCRTVGCSHFVSKPIAIDRLLATVSESLPQVSGLGTGGSSANGSGPARPVTDAVARTPGENGREPLVSSLPSDAPIFREIARDFAEYLAQLIPEMRQAVAENDAFYLAELAHALKGSAGTAGFNAFTEPARTVEILAKKQQLDAIAPAINRLAQLQNRIFIPNEADYAMR